MGSVVIIFLPILAPLIIILGFAEKLGYNPMDVLFLPFSVFLEIIINLFFGGSTEAFYSFMDSVANKIIGFLTENEEELAAATAWIAELLNNFL